MLWYVFLYGQERFTLEQSGQPVNYPGNGSHMALDKDKSKLFALPWDLSFDKDNMFGTF